MKDRMSEFYKNREKMAGKRSPVNINITEKLGGRSPATVYT